MINRVTNIIEDLNDNLDPPGSACLRLLRMRVGPLQFVESRRLKRIKFEDDWFFLTSSSTEDSEANTQKLERPIERVKVEHD